MNRHAAKTFFSPAEQEQIRNAIVSAESGTSGEIVPMVVDRSDDYREAELAAALALASLVALPVLLYFHHDTIWWFLPVTMLLLIPMFYCVRHMPFLLLPFISRRRAGQAVRERALRSFCEHGLHRTQGETGVLIYISLLERRVWILGDRGINARIAPTAWQEMVEQVVAGIRNGNPAQALCTVIHSCGELLKVHFPVAADDVNELRNDLVT